MSFWGSYFIFAGISSRNYGLFISSPDGGEVQISASNDVDLVTQEIFRRSEPYFYGVRQSPVMQFDVAFNSPYEIAAQDSSVIQQWLFGQRQYQKLQIIQADMESMYFNCFLKNPSIHKVGNTIVGYRATAVCDSPWAWEFEKTYSSSTYTAESVNATITFNNRSANNDYLYPQLAFVTNAFTGDVKFTNITDSNRITQFTGLQANETITMDNNRNILTSSTGLKRIGTFNKNWFRLLPGVNEINVFGRVKSFTLKYQFARKLGG